MNVKGICCTIISAILFGITPLLTMFVYEAGANAVTVVFARSLFVLPILFLLMRKQNISLRITTRQARSLFCIAIFGSGLTTILLFTSYTMIDIGTATTLHFLYPIFVSILCFIVYKEPLGRKKQIALCLAGIGTLCFFEVSEKTQISGWLLATLSAFTYAYYMVGLEKRGLSHENPYKVSFYLALFVTFETSLYQYFGPSFQFDLPLYAYGFLMIIGIISSFLAVVLLQYGIRYLGSSTASIYCLLEPITSIVVGTLFLHEDFSYRKMIGCILIFIALLVMTLVKQNRPK